MLLPSPFPRAEFHKAVELQTILNELMHKVINILFILLETPDFKFMLCTSSLN